MLKVAVCDDDVSIRGMLREYLDRFSSASGIETSATFFESGEALLQGELGDLDILILDIQMTGISGLDTARRIRATNQRLTIIFFTNYIEYALEGYEVQAYRFLLKPLTYEHFSTVVGEVLTELQARKKATLVIPTKAKTSHISVDSILYVETYKGHVLIHTENDTIESFASMKETEEALKPHPFLRCHTAFLVSLREIKSITQQDVLLKNGQSLPLSKHRRKAAKEALTVFWGEQFL